MMSKIFFIRFIENMELKTSAINFNGILYGKNNYTMSKPVYTCKYGDRLLISTFIEAVKNGTPVQIRKEPGFNKITLESNLDINFNLFDRMRYLISEEQLDMLNKKRNGEYKTLLYVLSDDDFANLKKKKSLQTKLENFSNILQEKSPQYLQELIKKHFV